MNWIEEDNIVHKTSLDDLPKVMNSDFPLEQPTRLDIVSENINIPLLLVKRDYADRLTVLNNGAMDLERSQGKPVFQRSSWWKDISSHQIYVCDPGTVGQNATSLNWMQTCPPLWISHTLAKAIRSISHSFGIRTGTSRIYYGSSAGGFAALSCLVYDPMAIAIVNNAQFDWTRWYAPQVREVLDKNFSGRTAADVRTRWPHRANALSALTRRDTQRTVHYWLNLASEYDRTVQLPLWNEMLTRYPRVAGNFTLHCYHDDVLGHNPLSRANTLNLLNSR